MKYAFCLKQILRQPSRKCDNLVENALLGKSLCSQAHPMLKLKLSANNLQVGSSFEVDCNTILTTLSKGQEKATKSNHKTYTF